jgi:hypothetical protein
MLNKTTLIHSLRLLIVALLLLPALSRQAGAGNFLLFYANDVHGETKPCG